MSNDKDHIDFFLDEVGTKGIAIRTVGNDKILMFRRDFMQKLLDSHPTDDTLAILLQTPTPQNQN